jgi:hypothetical protein
MRTPPDLTSIRETVLSASHPRMGRKGPTFARTDLVDDLKNVLRKLHGTHRTPAVCAFAEQWHVDYRFHDEGND